MGQGAPVAIRRLGGAEKIIKKITEARQRSQVKRITETQAREAGQRITKKINAAVSNQSIENQIESWENKLINAKNPATIANITQKLQELYNRQRGKEAEVIAPKKRRR